MTIRIRTDARAGHPHVIACSCDRDLLNDVRRLVPVEMLVVHEGPEETVPQVVDRYAIGLRDVVVVLDARRRDLGRASPQTVEAILLRSTRVGALVILGEHDHATLVRVAGLDQCRVLSEPYTSRDLADAFRSLRYASGSPRWGTR